MNLNKIKNYDYILVAIILKILFFYPLIFSDKTLFFRDIHRWFYPMKYFLAGHLKNGSIPYWCPNYFCGSPFMSDLQSGVFYPFALAFILFPFPQAFNIYVILHLFLGFLFFYHFVNGIGCSKISSLITTISYCYGGYTIASVNTLINLSTLIWLPAILWSFQRATIKNHKSGYFLTLLFICMAILGGEPQLFILMGGLLFFYGLISIPNKHALWWPHLRNALMVLLLIISGVCLTMVQLGPTYQDYLLSVRLGGITYEEASRFSLNFEMLKHLILPLRFNADFATNPASLNSFFPGPGSGKMPWLLTIYPGFMILPLALFGLFFNYSKRILLWFFTFFITLILALGDNTPFYQVFYKIFPFFRFPEKFIFLTSFSLLVMAAFGSDRLISLINQHRRRASLFFILILVILIIDLYSAHKNLNPLCKSTFYQYHHPYFRPILDDPETFRIYLDTESKTSVAFENTILNHHIKWQMLLMPNLGILHNLFHVNGTTGLELRYQYLITEILLRPWSEKIHFLKLANVKYIISSQRLDKKSELRGKVERINPLVYRINGYLPRAWMVGQLHPIKTGRVDELVNGSFDPISSALAKGDIVNRYNKPFFKKIDNINYEPNSRIHIELTAEKPGILVFSESSYPGWQVFVNGEERECLWLNLLFQGVEIDRGTHEIDFIYRPKQFKLFLSISLVSLALFFSIWFYCWIAGKYGKIL